MCSSDFSSNLLCEEVILRIMKITWISSKFRLFIPQEVLKYSEAKDAHGAKLNGKAEEAFSFYQIKFSTKPGRFVCSTFKDHLQLQSNIRGNC